MKAVFATATIAISAAFAAPSHAATIDLTLNPSSDGSLYTCAGCNTVSEGAYLMASGTIQGAVKFSSAQVASQVASAFLTVNPYGLPLWDSTVDVYGYGTETGTLVAADANAGTFLGTLVLPANLGYGQDASFDVSDFIRATQASFYAFNLRSDSTDVFSSLEYNYGHPAQLLLSYATPVDVPEPAGLAFAGLLALGLMRRRFVA
jgi:MYXO-CTERM domain-containing protein